MKKFKNPRQKFTTSMKFLPLLALTTVCGVQSASAILTWDLRAVSVTPGFGSVDGPKSVILSSDAGNVGANVDITFELWAVVTGADANVNETLTSGQGTILSSPGTLGIRSTTVVGNGQFPGDNSIRGNLSNLLVAPWKTATTARDGTSKDLDADGDLDVGHNVAGASVDFIQANAGGAQNGTGLDPANFHQLTNGREFKISIATFRVTGLQLGNDSVGAVNFVVPNFNLAQNAGRASFATDGVTRNGSDAQLAVAAPVLIAVPEPSAFGMVLLGAMGLVGFRRLGLRKA